MSLLLNALKKVEEGDSEEKSTASQQPPSGENTEASKTEVSATTDLDSVIEEDEPEGGAPKKERVEADDVVRVFASTEDTGSGAKKWVFGLVGIAFVGGGGYGLLISGLVPGLDLSILGGSQEVAVDSSLQGSQDLFQGGTDETIGALPIPAIDVQSDVDFADLRLPQNRPEIIGDEEYKRKIAIYTGYDIESERQRIFEESGIGLEQDSIFAEIDEIEGVDEVEEELDNVVRTAESSRIEKARIDARTSSEFKLNIEVNNGSKNVSNEVVEEVVDTKVVAEVDVNLSEDGVKRSAMLNKAQRLYYDGLYVEAEALYRNVLRDSPKDLDALRGLALVAVSTGRYQLAAATYLNILDYYPDDPVSISELINLRIGGQDDFYGTEKVLKNLIGKSPNVDGRIYFALGNLYSGNGKWYEAQGAYFEAHSREPSNPDYSYNLAVVFDYLNKPKLAARYYQVALDLSNNILVGFNRDQVKQRLKDIN